MVALGGCVVARGGHAWLLQGGMRGCSWGGMRGIRRDTEIQSMSGRYASYWNAFLLHEKNNNAYALKAWQEGSKKSVSSTYAAFESMYE